MHLNTCSLRKSLHFQDKNIGGIRVNMDFYCLAEKVWILINWLHRKPANLDQHLFNIGYKIWKKKLNAQCMYLIEYCILHLFGK